jgi:hypothetical protein
MRNYTIAAAVALALGGTSVVHAAVPSNAQCAAPGAALYVAGSSAAQNAFANALATDLFGGAANEVTFSGTNGNFKAFCGFAASGNTAGIAANTIVTVHYRGEGGSVVGVLPIINNKTVKFLDLTQAACQVAAPAVTGTSATVGTTDGWTGCVASHSVELGVADLEPTVFQNQNYPSAYSPAVFGNKPSGAALAALSTKPLFQQVFGVYINTVGINGGAAGQVLNLSRATVGQILAGNYTDWSAVPSATGGQVSSTSQAITVVNREAGSGSRAGASIFALDYGCNGAAPAINDPSPANDSYATGDALTAAAATNGAITYASIDNTKTGLSIANLSGVTPSNLAAATGQYDWWFEAVAVQGTVTSPGGTTLSNWLTGGELANVATAPHTAQVNSIPNVGTNVAAVPLTSNTLGGKTIYISPFSRTGNSCSPPVEQN